MIDRIVNSIENGRFTTDFKTPLEGEVKIIPGFVDTHAHMAEHGFFMRFPSLSGINSKKELMEFVSSSLCPEKLNVLVDYDESTFTDEKSITREDLDKISKEIPIILRRVCGHIAVLNTPAIEYFKDRVPEESIDTEKGVAFEYLPLNLYELMSPSINEIQEGILTAQERYLKKGITGILDFAKDRRVFDAYLNLDEQGKLKIKVAIAFYESAYLDLKKHGFYSGWRQGRVKIEGIKLFLDGSVGGRTASFYAPYKDSGTLAPFYTEEALKGKIAEYDKNGFKVLMHAIGTRAIHVALSSIGNHFSFHHRIEHFELPDEKALKTAKEKGVFISMQPNFVIRWWKMYKDALPEKVYALMHPYRKIRNEGIPYAFGSDSMPEGPLYGIKGAVEHPFEREKLTFDEAINYYTEKGAEMLDIKTGKITKGFYGDFVILDRANNINAVFVEGVKIYG